MEIGEVTFAVRESPECSFTSLYLEKTLIILQQIFLWPWRSKVPHRDHAVLCPSVCLSHLAFAGVTCIQWNTAGN